MYIQVLFIAFVFITICSASNMYNDGFFQIGTKNYYITPLKTNFFAARDLCIQNNADLATFQSTADLIAVSDYLIKNKEQFNNDGQFWISYFDLGRATGMFYSIATGRPLTSAGWLQGQPDNAGNNEHCLHIWLWNGKYGLNDNNCMANFRALCEEKPQWEPQPCYFYLLPLNATFVSSAVKS